MERGVVDSVGDDVDVQAVAREIARAAGERFADRDDRVGATQHVADLGAASGSSGEGYDLAANSDDDGQAESSGGDDCAYAVGIFKVGVDQVEAGGVAADGAFEGSGVGQAVGGPADDGNAEHSRERRRQRLRLIRTSGVGPEHRAPRLRADDFDVVAEASQGEGSPLNEDAAVGLSRRRVAHRGGEHFSCADLHEGRADRSRKTFIGRGPARIGTGPEFQREQRPEEDRSVVAQPRGVGAEQLIDRSSFDPGGAGRVAGLEYVVGQFADRSAEPFVDGNIEALLGSRRDVGSEPVGDGATEDDLILLTDLLAVPTGAGEFERSRQCAKQARRCGSRAEARGLPGRRPCWPGRP